MSHIFDEIEEQLDVGMIFQRNSTADARKRILKYEKICTMLNRMRIGSVPHDDRVVKSHDKVVDIVVKIPKKVTGSSESNKITVYYF